MNSIRFGTDGWRGAYQRSFTPQNVVRAATAAAQAFAHKNPRGTLYVGYGARPQSKQLAEFAAAAAAGTGLDVALADAPCPAPALGWTISQDPNALGGFMLTSSHNLPGQGCFKLRMADGGTCLREFTDAVELQVRNAETPGAGPVRAFDATSDYLAHLKCLVDVEAIRAARLKVVVDPMHGAAKGHLARLLRELGVEVAEIDNSPLPSDDGQWPEMVSPWTDSCKNVVVQSAACMGILCDGDGDRVGACDERGTLLGAHKIIALILESLVRSGKTGRVVTPFSGSALVRRQAARLGCPVTETSIGFKWIHGEMLKGDVLLGGEEFGGIAIPSHLCERDGFYVALLLCELMAKAGTRLSGLVEQLEAQIGYMEYERRDIRLDAVSLQMFLNILPGLNPKLVAGMQPVEVSHKDGLRLGFADGSWLLVRPSGTEPVMRVYAEAPTANERDALLDAGCALIEEGI